MTRRSSYILVATLCCLLALATSASAECAWVLYWSSEAQLVGSRHHETLSGYNTKAECEAAALGRASNIHRNWTGGFSVYGIKDEIVATMKCLPDTVDPRGPKGKN